MALPSPLPEPTIEPTLVVAKASPNELLQPGATVGEYLVDEHIGTGGFSDVYAATHPMIGKRAAAKVLSREFSSDGALSARFINEARAVNTIRHRNIVDIFSFGRLRDERLYLIMEMLEGESLETYLRRKKRLDIVEVIGIFHAVARALDATHAAGIVHRDLKPANVFLAVDGEGVVTPKLLDFGIAKLDSSPRYVDHAPTEQGAVLGTPTYMAPEQCKGEEIDSRADVYSFGVMLHRALTGTVPFEGKNVLTVAVAQTVRPAPPMSSVAPDLPSDLDEPVLRMLSKDPNERYPTVGEAMTALVHAAGLSAPRTVAPGDLVVPRRWMRPVTFAIAAALASAVSVGWWATRRSTAATPPQPAVHAPIAPGRAGSGDSRTFSSTWQPPRGFAAGVVSRPTS